MATQNTRLTTENPVVTYGSSSAGAPKTNIDKETDRGVEEYGGSKQGEKTLSWTTAAIVIFAFAMGSGVTSAGYLVSSTGVVLAPFVLIVTAFFSFAGSRLLLLICEEHPNSVADPGDAGRVVGGATLEWIGRGAQFMNFFLYLPVALDLCGEALAGAVPEAFP